MKIILDRIEKNANGEKIAVFECGDNMINFHESKMPTGFIDDLFEGVIVECEIIDEKIVSPKLMLDETEKAMREMRERLERIKARRKKK